MDIVLEIFDTFVLDRVYAAALPASASSTVSQYVKHVATASFSSMREAGTQLPQQSQWQYEPSTQYFSLEPSHWAYESSLPRDNIYRQFFSLFMITW
jgi:Delta7-sterol 5-desaturase